jgi:predicted ArsR family transcriptional regulator
VTGSESDQAQDLLAPDMNETRRTLLLRLKRGGEMTLAELAVGFDLTHETLRSHLRSLEAQGLVTRAGVRRSGRGRPEVVYELADAADRLFPQREGEVLRDFASFLVRTGRLDVLEAFFEERMARRREAALERVRDLVGRARMEAVADVLSEEGFMAEVVDSGCGALELRLCHCPIRDLVDVSPLPCKAEIGLVRELLGEPLARQSYIPNGEAACSYAARLEARSAG